MHQSSHTRYNLIWAEYIPEPRSESMNYAFEAMSYILKETQ